MSTPVLNAWREGAVATIRTLSDRPWSAPENVTRSAAILEGRNQGYFGEPKSVGKLRRRLLCVRCHQGVAAHRQRRLEKTYPEHAMTSNLR
jgi:hypothetical protein